MPIACTIDIFILKTQQPNVKLRLVMWSVTVSEQEINLNSKKSNSMKKQMMITVKYLSPLFDCCVIPNKSELHYTYVCNRIVCNNVDIT